MDNSNHKIQTIAAVCGAGVNMLLFAVKLYIGLRTASICIYTDSINNLGDVLCCVLAVAGFLVIRKSANENYPMGYGRAEHIASFVLSSVIILTGGLLAYNALERFFYPRPVWFLLKFAVILAISICIKLIMAFIFKRIYKKTGSQIIKTMYLDSFADAAATGMTLISFSLSQYAGLRLDSIFGLAISAIIVTNGLKLMLPALSTLAGKTDTILADNIRNYFLQIDGVKGVSEIMVYSYGKKRAATLKLNTDKTIQGEINTAEQALDVDLFIKYARGDKGYVEEHND